MFFVIISGRDGGKRLVRDSIVKYFRGGSDQNPIRRIKNMS